MNSHIPSRLLDCPPVSGTIQERHYEATGDCTWVQFTPEFEMPWAGVFGNQGISTHAGVFDFQRTPFAFVIACGVGWIVNVDNGQLAHKTTEECLVTALPIDGRPLVIAADWQQIYVYSREKCVWRSNQIALDGIRFDDSENGIVNGRCWQLDGWYAFSFKTEPCEVIQGKFITSKW